MRTDSSRAGREPSLGELVALATRDMSLLIRQEIELAKAELARQAVSAGLGAGFLVAAAGLAFGALIAGTIFLGELFTWAGMERFWAYLLTTFLYLAVAGLLVLFAVTRFRKLSPPERTIQSVRDDIAVLRRPAGRSGAGAAGTPAAVGQDGLVGLEGPDPAGQVGRGTSPGLPEFDPR
ncbi:putative Holin-X, holin superfamily III [Frankia sp. EI5c]|uniref:phage holin family protein n=1 Tax=Frankia sp. EI5c TaxID=683316 RepID=UPI0007C241D2|nr:phage holin family protein [Frankia sp. EI5c]OAA27052.1 putative Holin-X, holin superfamily III [Frankia sp. EI5c]